MALFPGIKTECMHYGHLTASGPAWEVSSLGFKSDQLFLNHTLKVEKEGDPENRACEISLARLSESPPTSFPVSPWPHFFRLSPRLPLLCGGKSSDKHLFVDFWIQMQNEKAHSLAGAGVGGLFAQCCLTVNLTWLVHPTGSRRSLAPGHRFTLLPEHRKRRNQYQPPARPVIPLYILFEERRGPAAPRVVFLKPTHTPKHQRGLFFLFLNIFCNRFEASIQLSRLAKAERRKKPSPPGPKPAPGIVTTQASSRILENISQELSPLRSTKTYGESPPP